MAITRSTIIQASTDSNYRLGQDIFLVSRRITNYLLTPSFEDQSFLLSADIADASGEIYQTHISIDESNNRIFNFSCTCSKENNEDDICKHAVALLLKYISRRHLDLGNGSISSARNSQRLHAMIQSYASRGLNSHNTQDVTGTIELEPFFHYNHQEGLSVEFKIGAQKKYVVKNLIDFYNMMNQHAFNAYGQNLRFYHEMSAFSANSQPLVSLVLQCMDDYMCHYRYQMTVNYGYYTPKATRFLPLSPSVTDALFRLFMNRSVRMSYDDRTTAVTICEGDPDISMTLSKSTAPHMYQLSAPSCYVIQGLNDCWILFNNRLYLCSHDFSNDMSILLTEMEKTPGQPLLLSEQQMTPFCGNIIRSIEPHVTLSTENVNLSDYMPPNAHFSIYLDNPSPGLFSCSAYADYDGRRHSVLESFSYKDEFRDLMREQQIRSAIGTYFHETEEEDRSSGDFIISNDDKAVFLFLEQGLPHFYQLGEVFISENMKKVRILSAPKASIGVSISGNFLELDVSSSDLPIDELSGILDSYKRRRKFYRLKSGEFLRLEDNSLSVLSELADGLHLSPEEMMSGSVSLPLYRASYVDSVLNHHSSDIESQRDRYFKSLIRDLKSVEDSDYEVPKALKPVLRSYQKTGFRWLCTMDQLGFGGILADDMGLGKTLQIITLLSAAPEAAHMEDAPKTSLIVCPSSLVYNWESEIAHFAPQLRTLLIVGSAKELQSLLTDYEHYDVLITSYDMLKRDIEYYKSLMFRFLIIDEAQYIKNHTTQTARAVCEVPSVTRFALTGTPIENKLSELWSIFNFLMPGFLYPYNYFKNELEQPIVEDKDEIVANRLKQMIRPFIMRRLKTDVLKELPEKLEYAIYSKMTSEQQHLYDASVLELQQGLEDQSDTYFKSHKIQVLAQLTRLRQICCDPSLVFENYHGNSAKLDTCIQLIQNAISGGHKVLLFSQFTSMLDLIETRLKIERIAYYRLDGSTKSEKRTQLVNQFNGNDVPVFMISLKAGGTGLNLTGADIVIHFDPWWNVAAQNQATDRAHRIGQKHTVTVYKMIARGTIEEKILNLQEAKKDLADQILSTDNIDNIQLTKEALMDILS